MKNLGAFLVLGALAGLGWLIWRSRSSAPASAWGAGANNPLAGLQIPAPPIATVQNSDASIQALAAAIAGSPNVGSISLTTPTALLTIQSSDEQRRRAAVTREFDRLSGYGPTGQAAAEYYGDAGGLYDAIYGGQPADLYPVLINQIRNRVQRET